nr:sensor histidine kinase [Bacteroidota bacterium]
MKKNIIIIIHLVFWFIVLSMSYAFLLFRGAAVPAESYFHITIKSALEITDFYIFYSLIIPLFFKHKKYGKFALISLSYIVVYLLFYASVITWSDIQLKLASNWAGFRFNILLAVYYTILYVFLGGLLKLAIDGYKNQQQKLLLEQQNVKNELALLRSQINPHFLFNTLNTIHSFVISNNPNAAKAVIKLSDIMRYMLYDATKEFITLDQELEFLDSYITLQNFRLEKPGFVKFDKRGKTDGIIIPPMLLIPFVENAFKHGKKKGATTGIIINLVTENNSLLFEITNFNDPVKSLEVRKGEGVGIKNLNRRLELLYPGKHMLELIEKDNIFTAKLNIELT